MDWAQRRQLSYALGALTVLLVLVAYVYGAYVYTPATCSDRTQNQDERGVDCGGVCARLCAAPEPEVVWTRAVPVTGGVYHAVALVKNTLLDAAGTDIPYQFSLYDAENLLVATRRGTFTLAPGESRVLFESAVTTGKRTPTRAFLEVLPGGAWATSTSTKALPIIIEEQGAYDSERRTLDVRVRNTATREQEDVVVTVVLYDAADIVITASEAKRALLGARQEELFTFTWPTPLPRAVERVDVQVRSGL